MIIKNLYLTPFIFFALAVSGQNLVPNGSFEEGLECPSFVANLDAQCSNWFGSLVDDNISLTPTPDWFHECSEFEVLTPPNVAFGYQEPLDGVGYAGIVLYKPNVFNAREIIGVELEESLVSGQSYQVSFAVSCLISGNGGFASNNIGIKLTTYPTFNTANFPTNDPLFSVDTIISDTTGWQELSFELIPDSAYTFLHIGNFFDDDNTETMQFGMNATTAYYVIDRVSIFSTLSSHQRMAQKCFNIYPNPVSDFIQIEERCTAKITEVRVIDINGKVLIDLLRPASFQRIDVSFLESGIYFLSILTNKTNYNEKIIKI